MQKIFVYSHGFGVRKDDRGLFPDIAAAFPDIQHIMFDYNAFDEASKTLTAAPLDAQARMLENVLTSTIAANHNSEITLICHSQGCISAVLTKNINVHNTILLAPPAQFLGIEKKTMLTERTDTTQADDGTIRYPRRDGSITIIKNDYWKSRIGIKPIELYNKYCERSPLTIVKALDDEVLTSSDFSGLSEHIRLLELTADHNFTGNARSLLLNTLTSFV